MRPLSGCLSNTPGVSRLLPMASAFYNHQLPALAVILMGFDYRKVLGESIMLDP